MDTREFIRRYAWCYCYVTAFFLLCGALIRRSVEVSGGLEPYPDFPVILIDPGHGGADGGATGITGVQEDAVNLSIAGRLRNLLTLMGWETAMTRSDAEDLSDSGGTIRQRKQEDLKNRVALANALPAALVVSIHQNHFPDSRYCGPQVFYGGRGEELALFLQSRLNDALSSRRQVKPGAGIYLLERIDHPAVLVECGFLSNPAEEQLLASEDHQKKLAAILAASLAQYADAPA